MRHTTGPSGPRCTALALPHPMPINLSPRLSLKAKFALPRCLRLTACLWLGAVAVGSDAQERAAEGMALARLVAFGDSLSSAGRGRNGPSTGPAPTAPSNNFPRLTWVQQLSEMLALPSLHKWEEGGSNYAVGGTTTAHIDAQVKRYLDAHAGHADPAALHTIWSGSNDLTHLLRDRFKREGIAGLIGVEKALVDTADAAAARLERQIDRLARAGARRFLWVNLPDLTHTPSFAARTSSFPGLSGIATRSFRQAVATFNRRMTVAIEQLQRTHPQIDLISIDAHALFDRMIADPAAFGFTDVKTPSRTSDRHLFFDQVHPTVRGHYQIARLVRAQLVAQGHIPSSPTHAPFETKLRPIDLAPSNATMPPGPSQAAESADAIQARFIAEVRAWCVEQKIRRRPHTLAELRADTGFEMKYRDKPAHLAHIDEAAWERFALSLADADAAKRFAQWLPMVATAARLSGDPLLMGYLREQLAELATWAPLQRAGWASGSATPGAWLGTGWAVRAIVQSLAQLHEGALPPELRQALQARLEAEIAGIREDWATKRTWFARIEAASSNQWALPLEALALASLYAGVDRHKESYEFAISGLLRTLDAQGKNGECVEGMLYAGITFESLLSAALAAQSFGDDRLINHPWFRDFPTWYIHHRQPGGFVINAFDSQQHDFDWKLIALFVADLKDPIAQWVLQRAPIVQPTPPSLALFRAALSRDLPSAAPPTYAAYPAATRVNWLESLAAFEPGPANRVSGFWMRGGHATDTHDHQDRGHVNFIVAGRPVLIEAGLSSYGIPEHSTHFRSVAGHNVLQVGAYAPSDLTTSRLQAGAGQILNPRHRAAPLTVHRLDETGGNVSVDASACYASVRRWVRTAEWDATTVTIRDEVELHAPDIVLFRWHLGEPAGAPVHHRAPGLIEVGAIQLACQSADTDTALHLAVESMPGQTLGKSGVTQHATVVVSTGKPVHSLTLTTRVALSPASTQ